MSQSVSPGVRGVIFDLSGTVIDYGSRGPVVAFVELFARHGVQISTAEARGPMGTHKRDHIAMLLNEPAIAAQWEQANGSIPTNEMIDTLYAEFTPLQIEVLKRHSDVIPGVAETVCELRRRGIKIGSTTGFDSGMMGDLIRQAGEGGFTPDIFVCPDMVGKGRPAPWMAFHAARQLDIYPMKTLVKVGDTPADVAEANAAGMWAVSIVRSGNEVGMSLEELEGLPPREREAIVSAARSRLAACGPHYLIDSAADLIPVIDEITARLVRGDRP